MACPHDNISLPTTGDPDTVCADCGAIINQPRKAPQMDNCKACGEILEPWEVSGICEGCGESEKKSPKQQSDY